MRLLALTALCALAGLSAACSLALAPRRDASALADGRQEYAHLMSEGRSAANERRYTRAIEAFGEARSLEPENPEPDLWLARALYRMNRVQEAEAACSSALQKDAELYPALPLCWEIRLYKGEFSPVAKEEILDEIGHMVAASGRAPGALLAASQGYDLLQKRRERIALLLELAGKVAGTPLDAPVASALFGELIRERAGETRRRLAEAYALDFPASPMAFYAARVALREGAKRSAGPGSIEAVQALLAGREQHRRLSAAAASWLVEKHLELGYAVELLLRSLDLADREQGVVQETGTLKGDLAADRALYRYWLGRARWALGDSRAAEEDLASALPGLEKPSDAYCALGKLAVEAKQDEKAVDYLHRCVELARADDAEALLGSVLGALYGYQGEPAGYFRADNPGTTFTDVTAQVGLAGVSAQRVAWGDYDNDGREDLLLDGVRLFRNLGNGFEERTETAGIGGTAGANGGVWGDYDNDGFLDLLVTSPLGNRLLRNLGGERFSDVTRQVLGPTAPLATEAAAWGDFDNDGFLDLYLANYQPQGGRRGRCVQDRLLHNDRGRRFEDISARAGILSEEPMCGRGVIWADLDQDGRQDIIVANYRLDPNFVFMNRGGGAFVEMAGELGVRGLGAEGAYGNSIGFAAGDLDGDGDTDLYVSNLAHPWYLGMSDVSMLLANSGPPLYRFEDRFRSSGIAFEETSADPALADVDNDGDLDLFVTSVYEGRSSHLYINEGGLRFADRTWVSRARVENAWGAAFADYDGDGDVDLLVASASGIRLLRNEGIPNHWIRVRIDDRACNRFGIGSKVTVRYGGQSQTREIAAGRGTGNQDSITLPFGLGRHAGPVDVEARTLCGDVLRHTAPTPDVTITLRNSPPFAGLVWPRVRRDLVRPPFTLSRTLPRRAILWTADSVTRAGCRDHPVGGW